MSDPNFTFWKNKTLLRPNVLKYVVQLLYEKLGFQNFSLSNPNQKTNKNVDNFQKDYKHLLARNFS